MPDTSEAAATINVRVSDPMLARIDTGLRRVQQNPPAELRLTKLNRSNFMRLLLDRGLRSLEAELNQQPTP